MGKMNISTAKRKAYAKEQRTMNNECYPKQTQSNPIKPNHGTIRNTRYEIRNQPAPLPRVSLPYLFASFPLVKNRAGRKSYVYLSRHRL